jgi:sugar/nucleoside kinase (ribokinase family)
MSIQTIIPAARGRDFGLLAVGNPNLDLVFTVARAPAAADKCLATQAGRFAGGTSANVACAAGRLGVPAAAFGQVGADNEGMFLAQSFQAFGVSLAYLRSVPGSHSSTAIIMVEPSGEKALAYAPIAGASLDVTLLEEALARSRIVYLTPYDVDALRVIRDLASARHVCVAVDLEAAAVAGRAQFEAWLSLADIVFMNDSAFRAATGAQPTAQEMAKLLAHGPTALVVTLGAAGALAVSADVVVEQAAYPAEVTDTTGAGDCFAAAFLVAALEGQSLKSAARFACAAASLAVTKIGARSGFPDRRAVNHAIARHAVTGNPRRC